MVLLSDLLQPCLVVDMIELKLSPQPLNPPKKGNVRQSRAINLDTPAVAL